MLPVACSPGRLQPFGVPRVEKPRAEGRIQLSDGRRLGYAEFGDPTFAVGLSAVCQDVMSSTTTKIRRPVQNRRVSMSCWLVSGSTNWSDAAEHFQNNEPTVRYSPVEVNEARIRIAHIHAHMLAGAAK